MTRGPAGQVQISAIVSEETRALLDEATEARGLKKGHVMEEALLHYLHALRERRPRSPDLCP